MHSNEQPLGAGQDVSLLRLYVLRATYMLIVVGLAAQVWPGILSGAPNADSLRGVIDSLLGAVSLLAIVGLRYPLAMLPLLYFELVWKTIWVVAFGLPQWLAGPLSPSMAENMLACMMGVVLFPIVIPWGHVWSRFVKASGDRWR